MKEIAHKKHYACQTQMETYGPAVDCCLCTDHNCNPKDAKWSLIPNDKAEA